MATSGTCSFSFITWMGLNHMRLMKGFNEKNAVIFSFLFVPIVLLLVFTYYPAIRLIEMSFTEWDGFRSYTYNYIGWQNYVEIFETGTVFRALINNIGYVIISILQTLLGLYFAIIVDSKIRARNFFRSSIFLPFVLNSIAIAYMFSYMYNFRDGPINIVIRALGFEGHAISFLGDSWFSNISLAFMGMWQFTGLAMIIFLGALQSINRELYESSAIDGGNFFHNLRYITIPSIKLVIQINLFLSLNGALQAFYQPFIMTAGGPGDRTQTFASVTYYTAFQFFKFGKASALAVILLMIILIVLIVQNMVVRSEGENE